MLKLISLNVERSLHLDTILPFLEQEQADIVCLMEVSKVDLPRYEHATKAQAHFFPMTTVSPGNTFMPDGKGLQGLALLTKLPHEIRHAYYIGDGSAPEFGAYNAEDRVVAIAKVTKDEKQFVIGTTHFTWTPNGDANEDQWNAFTALMRILDEYHELILCGDFNAPRGREMFTAFTERFTDNLPKEVASTLDPKFHRKPEIRLAVDTIFSRGPYTITVRVVDGLSDHKGLVAMIA